jgi:RHS repeat-associated protein
MEKINVIQHSLKVGSQVVLALALCLPSLLKAAGQTSTITNTVTREYDYYGNETKTIVEPNKAQFRLESANTYNEAGLKVQAIVTSPATGLAAIGPRTTKMFYYGGTFTERNALNLETRTTANFNYNRRTEVVAPDSTKTSWTLDTFGRPLKNVKADGSETRTSIKYCANTAGGTALCPTFAAYVSESQDFVSMAATAAVRGPWERNYFDSLDRLIRTETQAFDGIATIIVDNEYDELGRLKRSSRPYYAGQAIYWTTYDYDELDRVWRVIVPDGSTTVTDYNGTSTTVTNALNQSKTTTVNSNGQPILVKDEQNNVLTYAYDANGKLIKTVDPQGNVILMTYDILGRQLSISDPDRGTTTFEYDVLGQLKKQTDARGKVTTFNYDLIGRMIARSEADLITNWGYDTCEGGAGKSCGGWTDTGFSRTFLYDTVGRVKQEKYIADGVLYITPEYDATTKRLVANGYSNGFKLRYVYTALGSLKEVRNDAGSTLVWRGDAMDAEGHLTQQTYGNNVVTQNVFDPATGRLKNIYAGPGNAVQDMSFEYDKLGNMLWRTDATQSLSETFEYDSLNRLTANTVNSPQAALQTQSYSYDSIGNITSRSDQGTYAYGTNGAGPHAVSHITQAGGAVRQLSYDAIGSMVLDQTRDASGALVAAKTRSISYTSFGMPSTITANGTSSTFLYGPDHQRIKQTTPTGNTIYIHPDNAGGLGYERETRADGTVEHRYFVSADGLPVALIKKMGTTASSTITATITSYLHRDHLGSTSAITNATGVVVERMAYEPFGKRREPTGPVDTNNQIAAVTTDRGFTTHEHLDEFGLIHMNGRVYDPLIARFVSADPTNANPDDIASYNLYSYVHNNPLGATDPSGFVRCLAGLMGDPSRCGAPISNPFENMRSFTADNYDSKGNVIDMGNGQDLVSMISSWFEGEKSPTPDAQGKTFTDTLSDFTQDGVQVVTHTGTWGKSAIPNPNGIVPGGPWIPGTDSKPGKFNGPPQPCGPRLICQYVPSEQNGGPKGAKEPYWKTKDGPNPWQRYDLKGNPITSEQAHPSPSAPQPANGATPPASGVALWAARVGVFLGLLFYSGDVH